MATIGTGNLTLLDHAKRIDPGGKIDRIVEMLSQTNTILDDMIWIEANQLTSHRMTMRTGLPSVTWRLINQGVAPTKSITAQVDETIGMMEAWSEVDVDLAELGGEASALRLSEAQAFIEAMNQEKADTLFYGNQGTSPEEFTGFAPRYSSLSANNGANIVDAGGTGSDNSSIWLIHWGDSTVHGIYPKGSQAGLSHKDLGEETVSVGGGLGGTVMRALRDQWKWKCGLALKDWRYVSRGANIDISNLVAKSSAADLFDTMIKMSHRIVNPSVGKPVYYLNRTVFQMLDIQGRDDVQTGGQLKYEDVAGRRIPMFRGIPVRIVDALTETEARVV